MSTYAGYGAGAFGALGGIIEFKWEPDPETLAVEVMRIAGYLENFIPPLTASRAIAQADMENHFATESGPDGEAWAQLAEETVRKRGSAHPILQDSGELHAAAVSPSGFQIAGDALFIDTSNYPYYWAFHQTGTSGAPGMAEFIARARQAGLTVDEGALGGGMPARPFVGISEDAELQIVEVFDAWFAGAIAGFYEHPGGTIQTRLPSGQFGPAVGK